MLYLMTHLTHFIYGNMVQDHSDSEREKTYFSESDICTITHTEYIVHSTAFVTPVVDKLLECE